jgi:hypothetical protein
MNRSQDKSLDYKSMLELSINLCIIIIFMDDDERTVR